MHRATACVRRLSPADHDCNNQLIAGPHTFAPIPLLSSRGSKHCRPNLLVPSCSNLRRRRRPSGRHPQHRAPCQPQSAQQCCSAGQSRPTKLQPCRRDLESTAAAPMASVKRGERLRGWDRRREAGEVRPAAESEGSSGSEWPCAWPQRRRSSALALTAACRSAASRSGGISAMTAAAAAASGTEHSPKTAERLATRSTAEPARRREGAHGRRSARSERA